MFIEKCKRKFGKVAVVLGGDFNAQLPGQEDGLTGTHIWQHRLDGRADVIMTFLRKHQPRVLNTWQPPSGRSKQRWTWAQSWKGPRRLVRRQYDYICASHQNLAMAWAQSRTGRSDHCPVAAILNTEGILPVRMFPVRSQKGWKRRKQGIEEVDTWNKVIHRCNDECHGLQRSACAEYTGFSGE